MISFLTRYRKAVFLATITTFLIGTFVGLGGYLFTRSDSTGAVAEIDGDKIPYQDFLSRVNLIGERIRDQGQEMTPEFEGRIKQDILRDMIVEKVLSQSSRELGLKLTDLELAYDIQNFPAFQRNARFDQVLYLQTVRYRFRTTPEEFERRRRESLLALKLRQLLYQSVHLTPFQIQQAYRLRHPGKKSANEKDPKLLKEMAEFQNQLHQEMALETINYFLRQKTAQMEIRSFLAEREGGP
ncbi:MAG: SurA N-terminal domain-containing protein [Elusimicrobia bacterium]|nr:SurA N-terminal domain-containing protein [Elusimicrobiota bacterium]